MIPYSEMSVIMAVWNYALKNVQLIKRTKLCGSSFIVPLHHPQQQRTERIHIQHTATAPLFFQWSLCLWVLQTGSCLCLYLERMLVGHQRGLCTHWACKSLREVSMTTEAGMKTLLCPPHCSILSYIKFSCYLRQHFLKITQNIISCFHMAF